MTQGERVKEIRKALGLTLDKFGEKLGVTKQTISRIEKGVNNVTDQMAKGICREYGVSEDWLLHGSGEMFAPDSEEELKALVKRYGLSNADMVLLRKFMGLDESARKKTLEFMIDVVAALNELPDSFFDEAPDTPEELEKLYPPVGDDSGERSAG